jgi:hypothetical protein
VARERPLLRACALPHTAPLRVTKEDLREMTVLAQLDNKFILLKHGDRM